MSKHTPEPWKVSGDRYVRVCDPKTDADEHAICQVYMRGSGPERQVERTANSARIVSCVNACANLNPTAIPALIRAAEDVYACNSAINIAALRHALEAVRQQAESKS